MDVERWMTVVGIDDVQSILRQRFAPNVTFLTHAGYKSTWHRTCITNTQG